MSNFVYFVIVCSVFVQNIISYRLDESLNPKDDESFVVNPHYHNQAQVDELFDHFQSKYPKLAKKFSIGKSIEGRELLGIRITENVESTTSHQLRPMVKFTANIHGDESIGRQMLIYLAEYLLDNYGRNAELSQIVNETDLYLVPSINPDGFAHSKEGNCDSLYGYVGRHNAAGMDLNRDFPDRFEDRRTIQYKSHTRQPETAALVNWITSKPFVLSANFHGGAVVASYPYDNSIQHHDCCAESLTPDDRVFKAMAHTYANNHPVMRTGRDCNETFPNGITNGAYWYELNGGMQDFNYAFTNCFELTIELSCCKYPLASTLPDEWQKNKRSLIELIKLAQIGVKGLVQDMNGYPIRDAKIEVQGLEDKAIDGTERGEYWRLLTPGTYHIRAKAFGYEPSPIETIEVKNDSKPIRLDFKLKPIEAFDDTFRKEIVEKGKKDNYGFLTPTKFEHHNFTQMEGFIRSLSASYPTITRLYSIGKSVQDRDLWVLEIAQKPGEHTPGIPEFKYVANMHGNEVIGREMLLLLAKMMCENYLIDERLTKIVNSTRIHLLFSMNPDGYEISKEGDKKSPIGRGNIRGVDLNRNFPDQYGTNKYNMVMQPEVLAVMKWTLSIPFVLSANLHGGSLVANYPFDDSANDFNATGPTLKPNPTEENQMFQYLARLYSNAHTTMHFGTPCPLFPKEIFPGGITNGAHWYSVTGGMQDWNYIRAGVFELTLELSCDKFPMASELPTFWDQNREALVKFIEQVRHGVHGFIRSSIGTPVPGAMILLDEVKHATYSTTYGDYWKLAVPGKHNITVVADGFEPHRQEIEIPATGDNSLRLDISLMRDDPQHWASAHDFRIIKNVVRTRYHSNDEIKHEMSELENKNVQIASFEFGDNEVAMVYHTLKLTGDIGSPEETKFHILIVSSLFGATSPLGREITMNLARHFTEGHTIQEPPILKILNNTVLHFLPIMDGFEDVFRIYDQNKTVCDPAMNDDLAERILSPESERKRDLFLRFLENEHFDMILSFSAGGSDVHYPATTDTNPIFLELSQNIQKTEFNLSPIQCDSTSSRNHQKDSVQRITNLFYNLYHIPMFTLDISCCRMPVASEIAIVWRKYLEQIMNFIELPQTGIKGTIKDAAGNPMRQAYLQIVGNTKVYNATRNLGHFHVILPSGRFAVEFACKGFSSKMYTLDIEKGVVKDLGAVVLNKMTELVGTSEFHQVSFAGSDGVAITGFVLDPFNHPITNAKISVITPPHKDIKTFTDSLGAYNLKNVPNGDVIIQVEAPSHFTETRLVHVGTLGANVRGVVFRLAVNEKVLGLPRMFFIIAMGCVLLFFVACGAFCIQGISARANRLEKPNYTFSLLQNKNKELFEDDDDEEADLFTSPIKKGVSIQPYYDDEREPIMDTDEEEDEEEDEDIVMLQKRDYCDH